MFILPGDNTGGTGITYPEQFKCAGGKIIENAARVFSDFLADKTHPKALRSFVLSNMAYSINLLKMLSDSDDEQHKDIIRRVLGTEDIIPEMYLHSGGDVLKKCLDLQSCEAREEIFATDKTLFTMWNEPLYQEDIKEWLEAFDFEGRERIQAADGAAGVLFQCGYEEEVSARLDKMRFLAAQQQPAI